MGRLSDAKERLITTALALIWESSYREVGVNEICRQAQVKPGSFYYFFRSKEDLALAALDEHWQQTQKRFCESLIAHNVNPLQRIPAVFEFAYEMWAERNKENERVLGCVFGSFVGELGEKDERIRLKIENIFASIRAYFEKALKDAIAAGELELSPEAVPEKAEALLAYYEGVLCLGRSSNNVETIRTLAPHALSLIGVTSPKG